MNASLYLLMVCPKIVRVKCIRRNLNLHTPEILITVNNDSTNTQSEIYFDNRTNLKIQ